MADSISQAFSQIKAIVASKKFQDALRSIDKPALAKVKADPKRFLKTMAFMLPPNSQIDFAGTLAGKTRKLCIRVPITIGTGEWRVETTITVCTTVFIRG